MLNSFLFSLNSVLPIFLVITFGFFLKERKYLDSDMIKKINKISFKFCISTLLFNDIYTSDFHTVFDLKFVLYAAASTLIIFIVIWSVSSLFIKKKTSLGAFVQGCFRGNYAVIGIPLITSILGSDFASKAASITIFVIPIYNILAVIILTFTSDENDKNSSMAILSAVKNICKNPLIIGILIGFIFSYFNIRLPQFAESSINYIARLAAPLALIAIGGQIDLKKMKNSLSLSLAACFVKLVAVPIVSLAIAYMIGFTSSVDLVTLYVLYACPSAINSAIMAEAMGSDGKLAANIVLTTTLLSVFTFTIGVALFRLAGIL